MTKPSIDNSLRIAEIAAGPVGGRIGIAVLPGKKGLGAFNDWRDHDLAADLNVIIEWNAVAVVTLVEAFELVALQVPQLGEQVRRRGLDWYHWPIEDVSVPDQDFEAEWPKRSAMLRGLLATGARVVVHCRNGLGRSGMITARILVEMGEQPADAIAKVRAVRPGAIETAAQERWVAGGGEGPCLEDRKMSRRRGPMADLRKDFAPL